MPERPSREFLDSARWIGIGLVVGLALTAIVLGPSAAAELGARPLPTEAPSLALASPRKANTAQTATSSGSAGSAAIATVPAGSRFTITPLPASTPINPRPTALPPAIRPSAVAVASPIPLPSDGVIEDAALRDRVLRAIGSLDGVVGIAIKDLESGRGVLLNADEEYPAASIYKTTVMYEVFAQRESKRLTFDEQITISETAEAFDLGGGWPAGTIMTIGTALERMITISDNTSAVMLLERIGIGPLRADLDALGMQHTAISEARLTTSPRDMLRLLEPIARGQAVSRQASAEMVHLMLRQQINDRLPAGLPPGTLVAHKTGNWGTAVHDVGIVYSPRSTFVIAVLTRDLTDPTAGSQAIAAIARETYDHFQQSPGAGNPIAAPPGDFPSYYSEPAISYEDDSEDENEASDENDESEEGAENEDPNPDENLEDGEQSPENGSATETPVGEPTSDVEETPSAFETPDAVEPTASEPVEPDPLEDDGPNFEGDTVNPEGAPES